MNDTKSWFCEKIHNYKKDLYAVAYNILRNDEDVKDAIQETIYKAYKNLETLKERNKFKSWILKILTNTSYEIIRQRKRTLDYEDITELAMEEKGLDSATKITIWQAIESIDEKYSSIIILYYYNDLSIKEISKIRDLSIDAVKKRLSRGREMLKDLISDKEI